MAIFAQTERVYNLRIHQKTVNITGEPVSHALAINDQIPAPTLRFRKGEMAVIHVTNTLSEPTTLHWHGVLVPWNMDGPAFSNSKLILPGETFTFRFPIQQTGTYWYHSHTGLQIQAGLYGAIVIEDEIPLVKTDHDLVIILSDWTNEKPNRVMSNLKKDGDDYAFKKKFFPSLLGAIRHGAVWDYIKSEWTRMGPMDLSDLGYDAFLMNGQRSSTIPAMKPMDKVRLRVINASSSTYFYLNIGNLRNFTVISKDGMGVVPLEVNEILMGMGETYDLFFEVPHAHHPMAYEFRATAQDVTGFGSLILGDQQSIERVLDKIKPNPYAMEHAGIHGGNTSEPPSHGSHPSPSQGLPTHGDDPENVDVPMSNRLNANMLKSPTITEFDSALQRHNIHLELDGDMERYTWYINGKPFSEEKYILVRYNEVVRVTLENKTMMHHPMHLHGHFFRFLNGQGKYAPNFHTVDVGPMQTVTIEFWANEPGEWFFHCHNAYHMEMGMSRLVKYEGFERPPELMEEELKHSSMAMIHDDGFYLNGEAEVYTNHAELELGLNGGRWDIVLNLELENYNEDHFEAETLFKRYLSRFLAITGGGEYEDHELHALLGLAYKLPFNIDTLVYLRTDRTVVIRLKKEIPVLPRVNLGIEPRFEYRDHFDWELEASLGYRLTNRWSLDAFYRREDDLGHAIGFGFKFGF
ncbi:MAG: multicopper oxidase domain-containing protein [Deltaproteobacteria bacterium]|nr:multicopper oxidase domain-containing protein [Deltaproteobacteria bacterium]